MVPTPVRAASAAACLLLAPLLLPVGSAGAQPAGQQYYEIKKRDGYVEVDSSISLYYRIVGQGPDTVMVLHGGPGMHMNYLAPDLRPLALSHTLIFYDQRGAGRSKPLLRDTSRQHWRDYVSDLEALRRHFSLSKLNLLGHSWGGTHAILYAKEHPNKVGRLMLVANGNAPYQDSPLHEKINPIERMDERSRKKLKKAEKKWGATPDSTLKCWAFFRQHIKGYLHNPAYGGQTWGDVCDAPQETLLRSSYVDESLGDYDFRGAFEDFGAPVYIVYGENGKNPIGIAEAWEEEFPNSQLTVIEKAGHFPYFENPDDFFPIAKAFFQGEWPVDVSEAKAEWPPAPDDATTEYARLWWAITGVHDRLEKAFSRQDAEMGASNFTGDAILFAPAAPPIRSPRQIRAYLQGMFNKGARSAEFQTLDLEGTSRRVTEGGRYTFRAEDGQVLDMGKYFVQWEKVEGKWKAHRYMFNTTMEVPSDLYGYDLQKWKAGQSK